jgi:hypothetical protein
MDVFHTIKDLGFRSITVMLWLSFFTEVIHHHTKTAFFNPEDGGSLFC